jgi:hypothetical protein
MAYGVTGGKVSSEGAAYFIVTGEKNLWAEIQRNLLTILFNIPTGVREETNENLS